MMKNKFYPITEARQKVTVRKEMFLLLETVMTDIESMSDEALAL